MESSEIPDLMDTAARTAGLMGLTNIVVSIVCIWAAFWALQHFRFDLFFKQPKSPQTKLLTVFISVIVGHHAAKFIIEYLSWSLQLKWLF